MKKPIEITIENKLGTKVTTVLTKKAILSVKNELLTRTADLLERLENEEMRLKLDRILKTNDNDDSSCLSSIERDHNLYQLMGYLCNSLLKKSSLNHLEQQILEKISNLSISKQDEFRRNLSFLIYQHSIGVIKLKDFILVENMALELQKIDQNVEHWTGN